MKKQCLFCNKDIVDNSTNKSKKFCSDSCSNAYRRKQKPQHCKNCNKEFYHHNIRQFCIECGPWAKRKKIIKKCLHCGLEVIDSTRRGGRLFCSESCSNSYRQLQKEQVCINCKDKFLSACKRSFCNTCKYKARNRYNTKKKCLNCNKDIIDKSFSQNHNYCCKDCNYQYNKKEFIKRATKWKRNNPQKNSKINMIYKKEMYNTNPFYKIQTNLRNHLRTVLNNYTLTGKIESTKDYGININAIIKKFEKEAGFKFENNPEAIKYLSEKDIEHTTAIHKLFEVGKKYKGDEKELLDKIKILYSPRNLTLMDKNPHKEKTSQEYSKHIKLKSLINKQPLVPIIIREVSKEDAEELVNEFHYSDVMPRFSKVYLGGFLGDILVGIMTLGWGVQPERTIKKLFPSLSKIDYYEIGKLCMDERMPKNSESRFMSACINHIKINYPSIKLIYTWADGVLGKPGFVYQASNFLYGGHIWCKRYFTNDGHKIHPRSSNYLCEDNARYISSKQRLFWLTQEYMNKKGIKLYKGQQFKYCYFLCKDKEKKELIRTSSVVWNLNYPKVGDLKWQVKVNDNESYIDCKKPEYIDSWNAQDTKTLLITS